MLRRVLPVAALVLATSTNLAAAEDVLYSKKHLEKRQLNADGNYNMCQFPAFILIPHTNMTKPSFTSTTYMLT